MVVTSTMPEHVVSTAIELERCRLQQAFAGVYRPDGTIDEDELARFAVQLTGKATW